MINDILKNSFEELEEDYIYENDEEMTDSEDQLCCQDLQFEIKDDLDAADELLVSTEAIINIIENISKFEDNEEALKVAAESFYSYLPDYMRDVVSFEGMADKKRFGKSDTEKGDITDVGKNSTKLATLKKFLTKIYEYIKAGFTKLVNLVTTFGKSDRARAEKIKVLTERISRIKTKPKENAKINASKYKKVTFGNVSGEAYVLAKKRFELEEKHLIDSSNIFDKLNETLKQKDYEQLFIDAGKFRQGQKDFSEKSLEIEDKIKSLRIGSEIDVLSKTELIQVLDTLKTIDRLLSNFKYSGSYSQLIKNESSISDQFRKINSEYIENSKDNIDDTLIISKSIRLYGDSYKDFLSDAYEAVTMYLGAYNETVRLINDNLSKYPGILSIATKENSPFIDSSSEKVKETETKTGDEK